MAAATEGEEMIVLVSQVSVLAAPGDRRGRAQAASPQPEEI